VTDTTTTTTKKKQSNELKMISVDIVPVTLWSHLVSSQGVYVGVNHNYTIF